MTTTASEPSDEAKAVARDFAKVGLAREAVMVEDLQQVLALDRENTRRYQSKMLEMDLGEADDSMIHIGDVNYHAATDGQSAANSGERVATSSSWLSQLAGPAIVAASLLSGAGIGAVVPWLFGAFSKSETTIVQPVQEADQQVLGVEVVEGGAE